MNWEAAIAAATSFTLAPYHLTDWWSVRYSGTGIFRLASRVLPGLREAMMCYQSKDPTLRLGYFYHFNPSVPAGIRGNVDVDNHRINRRRESHGRSAAGPVVSLFIRLQINGMPGSYARAGNRLAARIPAGNVEIRYCFAGSAWANRVSVAVDCAWPSSSDSIVRLCGTLLDFKDSGK